jgi:hypothetical protein
MMTPSVTLLRMGNVFQLSQRMRNRFLKTYQAQFAKIIGFSSAQSGSANLRTQLERIMERAGVAKWPRLFQNMRASRETELTQHHPLHVVVAWIGNSAAIATRHYLQVTDADYDRANSGGAKSGALGAQNQAQQPAAACGGGTARNKASPWDARACA